MNNSVRNVDYFASRFYIKQEVFAKLLRSPDIDLIIRVSGRVTNHPHGVYTIPNKVALSFIDSKKRTSDWISHGHINQDSIPKVLKKYFEPKN